MIGKANEASVNIEELDCEALIDPGSMVSTVSEGYHKSSLSHLPLKALTDFEVEVMAAGDNILPYTGYIEANIYIPFINKNFTLPLLVTGDTEYNRRVPLVIGTNLIDQVEAYLEPVNSSIPPSWVTAVRSQASNGIIGQVRSTNKSPINVQPNQMMTVYGLVRHQPGRTTAVTEHFDLDSDLQTGLSVCPRLVDIGKHGNSSRIPVRICNLSAYHHHTSQDKTLQVT
ncbi:uncharacterized protein LOC124266991 [Haliotis rubra]|uniref:uncharacterized protein LOC124266991 n=1 Tax=Haliotis rubra TaxID=36100 RepID=UPI001EE545C7|nr:uncharacterized protein LOC124266991 [Haliotis rubra]